DVVELGPARDAVHVGPHPHARQRHKLVVGALPGVVHQAEDVKGPVGQVNGRHRPTVQHRPLTRLGLVRRDALTATDIGAVDQRDVLVAHGARFRQKFSPGSGGGASPCCSPSMTAFASDRYEWAIGESGWRWTIGSPWSPHSATPGSIGISPRNGRPASVASFLPPPWRNIS